MSATESLCQILGVNSHQLSREENIILEADLFARICEELKECFKTQYKYYFQIVKCNAEKENDVMENEYVRCVINDILSTEEYTLSGIACYTQTPKEVVDEIAMGLNTRPSAIFLRKIIEIHRSIRRDLYREILKKITTECSD